MAGKFQGAAAATPVGQATAVPQRTDLAKQSIELAFQHHQAGRIREAESLYQQALAVQPGQIDALYYLGVLYLQNGVQDAAEEFLTKALRKQPKFAEGHFNLGVALQEQGKLKEAAKAYNQSIKGDKRFVPAHLNLGNVYLDLEQFDRAASTFSKLIKLSPKSIEAHLNLGRASKSKGDAEGAMAAYRRALELNPEYADAHLNIGAILLDRNDYQEAKSAFKQALAIDPQNAEAYNNIGVAWRREGFLDHAMSCFARASEIKPGFGDAHNNMGAMYYAFGDTERAEEEARKGIEISPDSSAAYCILGKILRSRGKKLESIDALNTAIKLAPKLAEPYREIGLTLSENGQLDQALKAYNMALERDPEDGIAYNNAGMTHILLGQLETAIDCFDNAIKAIPTFSLAHSNKLYSTTYVPNISLEEIAQQHFEFGEIWDREYDDSNFTNPPDPDRPLKIGYVSPDLRQHVVVTFFEEILKAHDRDQVELFAYAEVHNPDPITERLKGYFDHWYSTVDRNHVEVAQKIRADGIDVLVDLAGHTGNNRLPVFGFKPAPIQASWIGYANTTGLKNMDYIFTTPNYVPPGSEAYFSEEIYYLPRVPTTFRAPSDPPELVGVPFERNGYVTFGCFNNVIKVGATAVDAWSEVLQAAPDTRLVLKSHAYRNEKSVEASRSAFEARGIDPARITFDGPSQHKDYLACYGAIDLALDPFPYNGGTTTLEALFMGIPLLALEGQSWVSRNGSAILQAIGEESLIASSVEDYIAKAVDFAQNPGKLTALRADLRERFIATGITDPVAMTRDVENAYRDLWQRWCKQRGGA
ncbi:glycosyltransferase family 41 protein [Pelagibius sp. Alg239-R121]|uniref:tetratricopeptide repeat protein n=1 Tax=Pelagibius sp. Alg239-R121 TaxID=2993448 RepID=UPI0024A73BB2|nr:glycosyltransferase family 41 protein [Pelagibius sp. Alg239-R121]